jgi:hypothetical protein
VIFVQQNAAYEAVYESAVTGLTPWVMVVDNQGAVVTAASSAAVIEVFAGSGIYRANRTSPAGTGQYTVIWSPDGTFTDQTNSSEDMIVAATDGAEPLPPLPPAGDASLTLGPCSAWTTADAVALCCSAEVGSDTSVFDDAVSQASELLFGLSGRRYAGSCQKTVRPCQTKAGCGTQVLSRGHIVQWGGSGWMWDEGSSCGCSPLDRVLLSGYPVREIVQVTIDGAVVDSDTYRLDDNRWLVRMNDPDTGEALSWPSCQNLARQATEDGTFAVTVLHGVDPPASGQLAAAQLACEIYKACAGADCALPQGTTRVARQGVVIERLAFSAWGLQDGIWRTGLTLVDAFLNSVNPDRLTRAPVIWSPASHLQYARKVG